jgi:cytoskeletal protein RodZ
MNNKPQSKNKKIKIMFRNKKVKFFSFLVLIIILIAIGVWIGLAFFGSHSVDANAPSPYTAVYMTSGDIYFGKLSSFPRLHMTDAWYLERTTDASGKTQVGVAPLTASFWGPVGDIYINGQNVLFYAPIKSGSQLVQAIENPTAATASDATANQQQQPQAPAVTTTTQNSK